MKKKKSPLPRLNLCKTVLFWSFSSVLQIVEGQWRKGGAIVIHVYATNCAILLFDKFVIQLCFNFYPGLVVKDAVVIVLQSPLSIPHLLNEILHHAMPYRCLVEQKQVANHLGLTSK